MIPKRLFWLTVGYGVGVGTTWYASKKVKAAARRYTPEGLVERVGDTVSQTSGRVRAAVSEGRAAMRERERELRGTTAPGRSDRRGADLRRVGGAAR